MARSGCGFVDACFRLATLTLVVIDGAHRLVYMRESFTQSDSALSLSRIASYRPTSTYALCRPTAGPVGTQFLFTDRHLF